LNYREIPVELDLFRRARTWEQRQDKKRQKQGTKKVKAEQGKAKASLQRETEAKVKFGKSAREKLDELGLHGKKRRQAKNYHRKVVRKAMEKNVPGAVKAKVV
jgi:hypothetical protein